MLPVMQVLRLLLWLLLLPPLVLPRVQLLPTRPRPIPPLRIRLLLLLKRLLRLPQPFANRRVQVQKEVRLPSQARC